MLITDVSGLVLLAILSSLIHEFGHIFTMIMQKNYIKAIKFHPFGIDIVDSNRTLYNYSKNILVLISGSTTNFLIALILKMLYFYTRNPIINIVFYQNIYIGILNLLPIGVLDGGQIVFIILSKKIGINRAYKIIQFTSILFLVPLAILGFLVLFRSKYNFSLLFLGCCLISCLIFKEETLHV